MTEPKTEGRSHPRAPIELKVDYKKLNSFFADYTKNISKGGTFIKTKKPLPIGTRFLFKLTVPSRDAPFELLGEVLDRRIGAGGAIGIFGTRGTHRPSEDKGQQHERRNAGAGTLNNHGQ